MSTELSNILAEKLGDKDLSYLNGMTINGYQTQVSELGKLITMTKDKESYYFLVDADYNIRNLNVGLASGTSEKPNGSSSSELYVKLKDVKNVKDGISVTVDLSSTENVESIQYYINDEKVYTGTETTYIYKNLTDNTDYKVSATVIYNTTEISNIKNFKPVPITTNGLVDYWPLQNDYTNFVGTTELIAIAGTPIFENGYMKFTGGTSVGTKNNYEFNSSKFTVAIQTKEISENEGRCINILSQGVGIHNGNSFGVGHDSYYPVYIMQNGSGLANLDYPAWGAWPTDSNWHSFVIVYDGTNTSMYYDGTLKGSMAGFSQVTDKLKVGDPSNNSYCGYANGKFRNLAVYNRNLSETEISTLFSNVE